MVVCILAAGNATRMSHLFPQKPKPLIPVFNKLVIDHQLDFIPQEAEVVLSLNSTCHLVERHLAPKADNYHFRFVDVAKFPKKITGPAISLLACKSYLQQPFWILYSDTLWQESLPELETDTIYYGSFGDEPPARFSNFRINEKNEVTQILDKLPVPNTTEYKPFIGLAYIKDYTTFFKAIENAPLAEDMQITPGFEALIGRGLMALPMDSWKDVGTPSSYHKTCAELSAL